MKKIKEYKNLLLLATIFTILYSFFSALSTFIMAVTSLVLFELVKRKTFKEHFMHYISIILLVYSLRFVIVALASFTLIYFNINNTDYRMLNIKNDYFEIEYKSHFQNTSFENIEMKFLNSKNSFEFYDTITNISKNDKNVQDNIYYMTEDLDTYYYVFNENSNSYFIFKSRAEDPVNNYFLKREVFELLKTIEFYELDIYQDIVIDEKHTSNLYGFSNLFTYQILEFWVPEHRTTNTKFEIPNYATLEVKAYNINTSDELQIRDYVVDNVINRDLITNVNFETIGPNNFHVFETIKISNNMKNKIYLYIPEGTSTYALFDFYIKEGLNEDDELFVDSNIRYILNSINNEVRD